MEAATECAVQGAEIPARLFRPDPPPRTASSAGGWEFKKENEYLEGREL